MAPSVAQTARIFEDSDADPVTNKKKGFSAFSSPTKRQKETRPLGERHINSPPQPKKVPLKDESSTSTRPPMHKKTGSTTSLKGFLLGREKSNDDCTSSKDEAIKPAKPKKSKSSTNLASLLKKRSKKDLKSEDKNEEIRTPPSPTKVSTPIWAQFATQASDSQDGSTQFPAMFARPSTSYTPPLTPQTYSDQHVAGPGQIQSYFDIDSELRMPQRPYLEKRGSRSSIFTEELHNDTNTRPNSMDLSQPRPDCSRQQSSESASSAKEKDITRSRSESPVKSKSRMFDALSAFNIKPRRGHDQVESEDTNRRNENHMQEVDSAFENVLGRYDIPQNLRDHMRNLKPEVKAGLVKGERIGSGSSTGEERLSARSRDSNDDASIKDKDKENDGRRSRSRSRPRSRVFSMSKRSKDSTSNKPDEPSRPRSKSRPKSADISSRPLSIISNMSTTSLAAPPSNDGTSTPGDFIHYLREVQKPELVEVGKMHKLRILLRNETVQWTDVFVKKGGMDEMAQLLHRIMRMEWREEHEDNLLHETLLCMKALATTSLGLQKLESMEQDLFPALLKMLFDPERKGPAEFSTRALPISLLFAYLSATVSIGGKQHEKRARSILALMRDAADEADKQRLEFVAQMHTSRPYRTWCKEVTNVTKEVFWIFLHHMNVVPVTAGDTDADTYAKRFFPKARAPHPAAPYVGGVEWEATQYLATQLDLLNGLVVSLPTVEERNGLREEFRQSSFEKVMGISLRTCKEKFYAGVHDGLRTWVAAARADGWAVEDVRAGPPREASSPRKSPAKKKQEEAPKLKLDVGLDVGRKNDDGWL